MSPSHFSFFGSRLWVLLLLFFQISNIHGHYFLHEPVVHFPGSTIRSIKSFPLVKFEGPSTRSHDFILELSFDTLFSSIYFFNNFSFIHVPFNPFPWHSNS